MRLVKKFLLGMFLIIAPFLYSQETHISNENIPDILKIKMDLLMQESRILKRENDRLKQELNQFKLNKRILQLKEDVARIRGFKIKNPLETQLMTKSELLKYIEEEFSRQYPGENLSHYQEALFRLGFIPQGCDVRETLKGLFAEQVAGLYDDTTQRFYLIDTFYQKNSISDVILAHEICHALQDQNFNIAAMGLRQPDNYDAVYAKLAMLEGDATILMSEWLQKNFNITNLFQLHEGRQNKSMPLNPFSLLQCTLQPFDHFTIKGHLHRRQTAVNAHLGFGGKIGNNIRICLHASQNVRLHQLPKCRQPLRALVVVFARNKALEFFNVSQQSGRAKIKQ